ncbi:MAG: signal peptidase II [Elusimicrobia bacterium GWC2_51_8]|nr:MAG: signal peptidase II [Elusimicrobia bacterium GWA2_51_34]OGR59851.1 MAG: signal peptidase II [Elusimicrobia bacterium GWC2_51_8]OGR88063.1 MAG: signal peptidase II [Elusimicrobia bacterium GWF2_52_66]HAF95768.1 signal peptidase II [Elusimicrobiota bacterium]HCE99187.1 signal peptidase II [Elusimicrobiota bacterium]
MKHILTPAVIAFVFILDRTTKHFALSYLVPKPLKIAPFFKLTYVENTGVAFGMFQDQNAVFLAFSVALVAGLLFIRKKLAAYGPAAELGLALVLGGALGNIYDRIAYGFVVDFFDLSFFPAVFNVGDSAITAGAVWLAWGMREEQSQVTSHKSQV